MEASHADFPVPSLAETFAYDWNGHIEAGLQELTSIATALRPDEVRKMRPRDVVALFGYQKRGSWLLQGIRRACEKLGVEFTPALDAVGIDGEVALGHRGSSSVSEREELEEQDAAKVAGQVDSRTEEEDVRDLVKIAQLPSARAGIVLVNPQSTLRQAWALMTTRGYSQLPVMSNSRKVHGVFSWLSMSKSIVQGATVNGDDAVRIHMSDEIQVCKASQPLLTAMSLVTEHEFALVRDEKDEISGIVTATDLAAFLREKYEPFSILGEIERTLRIWLGSSLDPETIRSVREEDSALGAVNSVDDLTFGEYKRIIERPENWAKLGLQIDRSEFVRELEVINGIRNAVMHFGTSEDGEEVEGQVKQLRTFLDGLRFLGLAR